MRRKLLSLTAVISLFGFFGTGALRAADSGKPIQGTLSVGNHAYKLAHVVAYETKSGDETRISILASDRKIPIDQIKESLREHDGDDDHLSLTQPHVRVTFGPSGEASLCRGWADNTSFVTSGDLLSGELKIEAGKACGKAQLRLKPVEEQSDFEKKFNFKSSFEMQFDVALGVDAAPRVAPKSPAGPVKPSLSGTFKGNGKPAKLAFVSARPGEPFSGKPSIDLIFTERDHTKDKQAKLSASFGRFGSALVISLHEDGSLFSSQVIHTAHSKQGFSSIGTLKTRAFDVDDGKVEGHLTTDGVADTFGETWEVDLKFTAPYAAPAAKANPADEPGLKNSDVKSTTNKPAAKPSTKPTPKSEPAAQVAAINVHDLAILKDATDIEYTTLVEHLSFKHATAVQALAGDFSKKLAGQGWKGEGSDLVTAKSAIIHRKRGDATLTIFIKPSGKGSTVTVMSTGLDWSEKQTSG